MFLIIWICQEYLFIKIKNYNLVCSVTAYAESRFIYIPNIFIWNFFLNVNIFLFFKVFLKIFFIIGVLTLYCKRFLFLFVKLRIAIKKSFSLRFANLKKYCKKIKIKFCKNVVCSRTNHRNFNWNIFFVKMLNKISNCLFL